MGEKYDENIVPICSVSKMAHMLGLSRARLYQLIETGIFPPPIYCIFSKRPFYTTEIQNACLEIRKNGIGYNGHVVIFNNKKKNGSRKPIKAKSTHNYSEFVEALAQMKLKVTSSEVENAIHQLYPDRDEPLDFNGNTVVELYRHLNHGV